LSELGKKRKINRNLIKKIVKIRINYLLQKAHDIFPKNKDLSNRYIYLVRRYSQRAKVEIPLKWKNRICNNCKMFLYPGMNYRIRLHSQKGKGSHISLTCFECNQTTRYFIKTKRKKEDLINLN
jgi:ribonuclease P protein subunit RPR2